MPLPIKGLQKTSLIDYSPYTSCVVFVSGCNFRCGFCQNPDLLVEVSKMPSISEKELFSFLEKRKKWLDGVCITGGEPCLYDELLGFVKEVKDFGYKVKLDTNGTNPAMLKELIDGGLVDYIAMDIKGSLDRYDEASGVSVDKGKIKESVKLLMDSGVEHEFRMTCVPGLVVKDDFVKIGEWLKGANKFFIQQFRNKTCLDTSFEKIEPFSSDELEEFKAVLDKYVDNVEIRA